MTTLSSFEKTDLVHDHLAADYNRLMAQALRPEFTNTETITATKELSDNDCQFQFITASGANRTVELAPEGTANHITIIYNSGASNNVVVKDDSGTFTFATLAPDEWQVFIPLNAEGWRAWSPPEYQYKISVTIVSNDLVVALQHLDDTDPSPTRPICITIAGVKRYVTAATSITLADATNWFNAGSAELATKEIDYFLYAIWDSNSSVIAIGPARIPWGRLVSDFNSTSTNENYLGNYANYTSTDPVTVIGRFAATLSAAAGHIWTSVSQSAPTNINTIHHPIFKTRRLDWAPTLTGYSVNPTSTVYQYVVRGRFVDIVIREGGDGTSSGTATSMTAPFTALTLTNAIWIGPGSGVDNSVALTTTCRLAIGTGSNSISLTPNMSPSSTWTGSGGKRIAAGNLTFPIG